MQNFIDSVVKYISLLTKILNRRLKRNKLFNLTSKVLTKTGIDKLFVKFLLRCGATPILIAKMKDNSKIIVDLRSGTEFRSYFSAEYDDDLISILHKLINPNDTFLDIGANIGFYTVSIASLIKEKNGKGKVIAFEPLPGNYTRLADNVKINNLEKYCILNQFGLSNSTTNTNIILREDFLNGAKTGNASISINNSFDQGFETIRISLDSLDNYWEKIKDKSLKIGLIKMDIEGHEDLCLQGSQKIINYFRPTILMEINKPYFSARQVKLDETFFPFIPKNYSIYSKNKGVWGIINSLDDCSLVDNVFLIPNELIHNNIINKINLIF